MRAFLRWLRARWAAVLIAVGIVFTLVSVLVPLVFSPGVVRTTMTPAAEQAIAGLRESSVYVRTARGAQWKLDVAAARKLIGDRPLLVAGFADPKALSPDAEPYRSVIDEANDESRAKHGRPDSLAAYNAPLLATCDAIAAEYRDTMVVVLHPRQPFAESCIGPDFPRDEYDDRDPPFWPVGVLASASTAAARRIESGDLLPLIADLVPAFERAAERLDDPPEARNLGGPFRTLRVSGYVVGGVVAAALLFLLLRRRFGAAGEQADGRRQRSGVRAQAQADVHELADRVLSLERDQARKLVSGDDPPDPRRVLTLAEGYLHIVRDFEGARTTEEYRSISRRAESLLHGHRSDGPGHSAV